MAVAKGAIYECSTAPGDFPPLVVVLMDGKVPTCLVDTGGRSRFGGDDGRTDGDGGASIGMR